MGNISLYSTTVSGADPGFPIGGHQPMMSNLLAYGAGAGMSAGAGTSAVISSLPSDSENREAEAVSDFVGWTRSSDIFSTELCST